MPAPAYHLEPMQVGDYRAVMEVWNECEGVRADETPAELARILDRNPGLCLVARSGGDVVGAVFCCHDGRRGYLYHLGVLPAFRRQGIAAAMVARALDEMTRLGIRRATIFLVRDNQAGQAFWHSHGWRERTDLVAFAMNLAD